MVVAEIPSTRLPFRKMRRSGCEAALQQRVKAADAVSHSGNHESCALHEREEHRGIVHLAIPIGNAGEVKRRLLQAESRGLETLPVPEQLEEPDAPARSETRA